MKVLSLIIIIGTFCSFVTSESEIEGRESGEENETGVKQQETASEPYQYKYTVKDEHKQLFFEKTESGDDKGKVTGKFSVLLADGKLLTVEYVADKEDGFVPKISLKTNSDPFSPEADDSVK